MIIHSSRIATALSIPPAHSLEMNSLLAVLMQRHFRTSRTELLGEKKSAWKRMKESTFFSCIFVLCGFICQVLGNHCLVYVTTSPSISLYTHPLILSVKYTHTHTHKHTRSDFAFRYENVSMLLRYLTVKNKNTMRVKLRIKINHNKVQSVYFLRPKLPLKYLSITTKE